jgi:hypothetical protein
MDFLQILHSLQLSYSVPKPDTMMLIQDSRTL